MEVFLWVLIVACFILSFVGLVVPILPAALFVWAGAALYHFFIDSAALGSLTWVGFIVLTTLMMVSDQLASVYSVKRYGGSRLSSFASFVGAFIGLFAAPPWGVLVVPFFLVFLVELVFQKRSPEMSMRAAVGTIVGFVSSLVAKALLQLVMIILFLADVFA
ncbi:MAG: DUF456 family protein [Firmicutes bacterium]|nr:DUF456 family protein [Bacillota bacterium]